MRPKADPRDLAGLDRPGAFGALVRGLSEPESGPHADNLMTNEDSFPRPCGEIAREVPAGGVYLGVGPDQNFTYIAHARPALALIVDYRRRNLLLHLIHKALFAHADDRMAYLERLTARHPEAPGAGGDLSADALVARFEAAAFDRARLEEAQVEVARTLEPLNLVTDAEWAELARMQARLAGPGMAARFLALPSYPTFGRLIRTADRDGAPAHMLAREALYARVRDAQRDGRVVPLVGDLAGSGALPRLAGWLRDRGLRVSLAYVSDAEFFLLRAGRFDAYVANLGRLPWADGARLLRTSTRPLDGHPGRVPGDAATTVLRPVDAFLDAARAGRIRAPEDLFTP